VNRLAKYWVYFWWWLLYHGDENPIKLWREADELKRRMAEATDVTPTTDIKETA